MTYKNRLQPPAPPPKPPKPPRARTKTPLEMLVEDGLMTPEGEWIVPPLDPKFERPDPKARRK
jgi:hypothetical protein